MSARETTAAAAGAEGDSSYPCANCLSAEGGGGLAFPRGAAGRVYHLDAASFDRYCALQGTRERRRRELEARIYGFRDMRVLAFWIAAVLSYGWLARVLSEFDSAAIPLHLAAALVYAGALVFFSWRAPSWFSAAFPEARPLSTVERWEEQGRFDRGRKALSAFWFRAMHVAVPLFIALLASTAGEHAPLRGIVIAVLQALALIEALLTLVFLYFYLPSRIGPPTPKDLKSA